MPRMRPRRATSCGGWLLGSIHQGYYLDPGRTAVCGGKPSESQRQLVEAATNIVETLIGAVRPGVTIMEIAKMGERMTREAGGGGDQTSEQWPLYGHGLGLFWEDPYIGTQMCTPGDRGGRKHGLWDRVVSGQGGCRRGRLRAEHPGDR